MRPVNKTTGIKYKHPTARAIRRAVASSTAIECDQSTIQIERRLRTRTKAGHSRKIKLAD